MMLAAPVVFALTGAAFVVLHIAAWKWAGKLDRKARLMAGIAALLLCLPGLWFALYYLHWLPEPPLLYQLRALPFSEGFLAAFGIAAGLWRSLLPKLLKPFPTAAGVFLLTIPFLKPVVRPLDKSQLTERWQGDACIQSSAVTCGPASAASILRYLGDPEATEAELARNSWTSQSGTEAWHLARAVKQHGFKVRFLAPDGLPDAKDLPGILGTGLEGAGHFIAVLEMTPDEIVYVDPLRGKERMTIQRFLEWRNIEPFFMSIQR
ncbi:cysteine peptidase family C39 domain-containing protein [Luteolibacter sp. Populi]|uniref:cysteine peptidase family C39 domain-containing protein n=1 Tax=Luteolibacter sp. Populi TaxID=3230487 RepID=UPI003466E9AD